MLRRGILIIVAIAAATIGVKTGTADAAVPVLPHGVRAPMCHGVWRYYLDTGTMYSGVVTRVTFNGKDASMRPDGTWMYVGSTRVRDRHTFHIVLHMTDGNEYGGWVRFKKIQP